MKKNNTNMWVAVSVVIIAMFILTFYTSLFSWFTKSDSSSQKNMQTGNVNGGKEVLTEQLQINDTVIGEGREAHVGDTVAVHYTGRLQNGTVFDSSVPRGQPFTFTLGQNSVIAGWEKGLIGMKVGGKRVLTIPPTMAYGSQSIPDETGKVLIPANSTLVFDVELIGIK